MASLRGLIERWTRRGATQRKASQLEALIEEFIRKGGTEVAGVNVTHDTAIRVAAVLACARVIAEGVSQVPFRLMRADGRNRSEDRAHSLADLLHTAPNEWMTSFELRETLAMHAVLTGAGYAYVVRNPLDGRPIELLPLPPGAVAPRRVGWDTQYALSLPDGSSRVVSGEALLVWRGPSWDTWTGMDIVRIAASAIGIASAADKMLAGTFENQGRIPGILSNAMPFDADKQRKFREEWQKHYGGAANSGKVAVLTGDWKWTPVAMSMADAQMTEQRRSQIEEICRVFRVMPLMIGMADKTATYASVEQMMLAHVVHTLGPWYARLEQSTDRQLLSRADRDAGYYTKFRVNALLRGAMKDRADFYTRMYGIGTLSPNEIRELEELNPYPAGDQYRVPLNMVDPAAEPEPEPSAEGTSQTENSEA